MAKKSLTVEQFIRQYPKRVQTLTRRLRKIVTSTVPETVEAVYVGWQLIGYRVTGIRSSRYFCYLGPMEDHVRLGFEYGRWLSDPSRALEGSGTQVRYVAIRTEKDLRVKILQQLIAEALIVALARSFFVQGKEKR